MCTAEGGLPQTVVANSLTPCAFHKDPAAQLQKLATQHSEELLKKLSGSGLDSSALPPRSVPLGSEALVLAQSAQILSPQPVKGSANSSSVLGLVADEETTPRSAAPLLPGEDGV